MTMQRRTLLKAASASVLAGASLRTNAQSTPVKILVGYPPGGAPDAVARLLAEQMRQHTGEAVVVENRAGASGKIAMDALLAAAPNGLTLAVVPTSNLLLTPMITKLSTYEPARDMVALASLCEYGFCMASGPGTPATDLKSFLQWCKAHPAQAGFATPGLGTPQHFVGAGLAKASGVELLHVPYKGGANALTDAVGGQVPSVITTEQTIVPMQRLGKLHGLFVTSPQRHPKLPEVPTARELGYAQLEIRDWFGLFARTGLPQARSSELSKLALRCTSDAGYAKSLDELGYDPPTTQPQDLASRMMQEKAAWTQRAALSGFKATD